jgi:hypothetical protein
MDPEATVFWGFPFTLLLNSNIYIITW